MNKYRNKKTAVDGIVFHSKKEADRYSELKIFLAYKKIKDLVLQPRFPIEVNGVKICTYVADFMYIDTVSGETVIEDVKGLKTREYITKKKLFEATTTYKITEI